MIIAVWGILGDQADRISTHHFSGNGLLRLYAKVCPGSRIGTSFFGSPAHH